MIKSVRLFVIIFITSFSLNAKTDQQSPHLKVFLKNWSQNNLATMLKKPWSDSAPKKISNAEYNRYFKLKNNISSDQRNKADIDWEEDIRHLVEPEVKNLIENIYEIKENQIGISNLNPTYWAGYWWSTFNGMLGARFGDGKFLTIFDWRDKYQYTKDFPPSYYIQKDRVRKLSPSEKIDLLVGDNNFSLTNYMWNLGRISMEDYGQIFYWDGLCDGLALASVSLPKPTRAITLYSKVEKIPIKFYPEDIKALGTLLYTRSRPPYRLIGSRCDERLPQIDQNGRFISRDCFNINPGSFHLSLVNQIGLAKRSFIMDSVSSDEVWNYPVVGYSFKYFNPQTLEEVDEMKKGIISYKDFSKDKFSKYRSKKFSKIIGVQAEVKYIKDRLPIFKDEELPEYNKPGIIVYRYDLEMDDKGNILGGEWYHSHHPDFLWVTEKGIKPEGPYDREITSDWDLTKELIPNDWVKATIKTSLSGKIPGPLVRALFKAASEGIDGVIPK